MKFGERIRQLRNAKGISLRQLAPRVNVGFTYLSRVETGKLNYGDYPSDALIHRLADALDADEDELVILAKRVPASIRTRVLQRPDVFSALAACDDKTLDNVLVQLGKKSTGRQRTK